MQHFLPSRKEKGLWATALMATIITGILNFQEGPSYYVDILVRPIIVSLAVIGIGFILRLSKMEIVGVLKKYAIFHFLSLFTTIPYFIWYFLGQDQYGAMVLILGIININLITVLQVATIFGCILVMSKLAAHKARG